MRIVILGSAHPLRGGGIASFNERLAYALQEQGHEVDIYSFSLQYPNFLFPGKSQVTDEQAPKGLHIVSKVNSINPFSWIAVGNELRKAEYDLLIVRYWMPFFGLCLGTIQNIVRRNKKTKIVCIADNIIPHEKRIGDDFLTNYFLKNVDACITMSKSVLKDLYTYNAQIPAVYTPHPLYDNYGQKLPKTQARQMLGLGGNEKIILFFGFIRKYKGLDILLEAMADPVVKSQGIKLLIVGEYYDDSTYYEALLDKYAIRNQVQLHTDFVPNDKVGLYFSASDCVVLPYRTATQSGITQVAYYFSLPMIVSNVGGLPELVRDDYVGYVVEPNSKEIAQSIVRFFKEEKSEEFIANIEKEKQRFSWEEFTRKVMEIKEQN